MGGGERGRGRAGLGSMFVFYSVPSFPSPPKLTVYRLSNYGKYGPKTTVGR